MKTTRAPTCKRAKARRKKICAQLSSAIDMALNFLIRMESVKDQDHSLVIFAETELSRSQANRRMLGAATLYFDNTLTLENSVAACSGGPK
jgi:hypothetical protein